MLKKLCAALGVRPKKSFVWEGACRQCGVCCRSLLLVDRGRIVSSAGEFCSLRERFPPYARFVMNAVDRDGHMRFSCDCLTPDNTCSDYKNRPAICRHYPHKKMPGYGGSLPDGCGYRPPPALFEKVFREIIEKNINR